MKKSFVIITLVALGAISIVVDQDEKYSEVVKAAIQITDNAIFGKIQPAAFAILMLLAVFTYQLLSLFREWNNRQILILEIDQLTTQHRELSAKYINELTSESDNSIESQDQRFLKKAIKIAEDNIGDPGFNVESMTREIGMSRANLHRKLKAITGFPPGELIRNIRLEKAATLLLNQTESVSQIGYIVGFEDHSYFSKAFKKQFGVPPSAYLRSKTQHNQLNQNATGTYG
jgi:AraC-like DNA-binding protein